MWCPKYSLFASLIFAALVVVVVVGCDGMSAVETSGAPDEEISTAEKLFVLGQPGFAEFVDKDGAVWRIEYAPPPVRQNGVTTFKYRVTITPNQGKFSTGSFFAMQLPTCAVYASSVPEGGQNENANGTLEWHYNDLEWTETSGVQSAGFEYSFVGESVKQGIVNASFKTSGDGSEVESKVIAGPCRGRYTISGTVFLNDPGDAQTPGNSTFDEGKEPGISKVKVSVTDSEGTVHTAETGGDGTYSIDVQGPPVFSGAYTVSVDPTSGGNEALFDPNLFRQVPPSEISLSLQAGVAAGNAYGDNNFGFEIDLDNAIKDFDSKFSTDALPRMYWRVQATGKGNPDYRPDRLPEDVLEAVALLVEQHGFGFAFNNYASIEEIAGILKNANKNDPKEGLRTATLVLGLNYLDDRGLCDGGLNTDGRCSVFDGEATLLVLEHAILVLRNSGYTPAMKIGDGSVEKTTTLAREVSNDA